MSGSLSRPSGSQRAARALRVGVILGVGFALLSVVWDLLLAPEHMTRLLMFRGATVGLLLVVGALSYALPQRTLLLAAASAGVSAVGVAAASLVLPFGFAYAIGGLLLMCMAIAFVSLSARAAIASSAAVFAGTAVTFLVGRASDDMELAVGFFLLPGLAAAVVFPQMAAVGVERARAVRRELHQLREDLSRFGRSDELTGVYDGKQLSGLARREIALARRRKSSLSALKIDIRHLARINAEHGRDAGNETLRAVASMCQATLRETDLLGRLAGGEFAAVLPEADVEGASILRDRLQQSLRKASVLAHGKLLEVTVEVGAATLKETDKTLLDVLDRADEALRAIKDANLTGPSPASPAAPPVGGNGERKP